MLTNLGPGNEKVPPWKLKVTSPLLLHLWQWRQLRVVNPQPPTPLLASALALYSLSRGRHLVQGSWSKGREGRWCCLAERMKGRRRRDRRSRHREGRNKGGGRREGGGKGWRAETECHGVVGKRNNAKGTPLIYIEPPPEWLSVVTNESDVMTDPVIRFCLS